jgi:hypothetical protein
MDNRFSFEQMSALITWLEEMQDAGYTLNDCITNLTGATKNLPEQDQDLSDVS